MFWRQIFSSVSIGRSSDSYHHHHQSTRVCIPLNVLLRCALLLVSLLLVTIDCNNSTITTTNRPGCPVPIDPKNPDILPKFLLLQHCQGIITLSNDSAIEIHGYYNNTMQLTTDPTLLTDSSLEKPIELSRSKREVFRGQNYHYQRGYELSRLRFENRHPDRPKAFFVREYHEGRDVPKQLLHLTQPHALADKPVSAFPGATTPSTMIETDISAGGRGEDARGGSGRSTGSGDSMKTMSDDYLQRLYATKAALKAALQHGDKDLSILEYIKAKAAKEKAKAKEADGGDHPSDHDEQTKEGHGRHGDKDGHKDLDPINKGVLFDEQIKEDLDKIVPYDPSKSFGERLRPYTFVPGQPNYPTTRRPSTTKYPGVSGIGGSSGGIPGGRPYPSRGGSGSGGSGGGAGDNYLNKLRRLYPNLFPDNEFDRSRGSPAGASGGGGGSGDGAGAGRPTDGGDGGDDGGSGGSGPSGGGSSAGSGAPSTRPYTGGGAGGAVTPWQGGRGTPGGGGAGGTGGTGGNRTAGIVPPGGSGFRSPYPSRFPGTRLSGLTLWPNVRNSTYPGIPGYIRYDYPGYSAVPYTGFRCDLMPYKYGYYADVAAGCQVFHVCQKDGRMDSFLCPNGTLFHQKVMTCDWWYHVSCPSSPGFFYLNGRIGVLPFLPATLARFD